MREGDGGKWGQREMQFDPVEGTITLTDFSSSRPIVAKLRKNSFNVMPSPYRISQYPDALVLHLYPIKGGDEDISELHISAIDRKDVLEWSYYLHQWKEDGSDQLVTPLTQEERDVYRSISSQPESSLIINRFNIPITAKTLHCLNPEQWLCDEIVNFYFALIEETSESTMCWNSFFYTKLSSPAGYAGVKTWTAKRNVRIFSGALKRMFIPIHTVDHWALGVVDFEKKYTRYLDSLGSDHTPFHANIMQHYLQSEYESSQPNLKKDEYFKDWRVKARPKNLPLQSNGSDCGVFICMYALALSKGIRLGKTEIGASSVANMRKRIAVEIARGTIFLARKK